MDPGTRLNQYEVVEPLGKGGMGEVYRAHDSTLGRDVAIKLLPAELAGDTERLGRLRREARSLAALNHPHIATVHGFEVHEDTSFMVMELVEGPTLADRLDHGPIPTEEALDLAGQMAEALEAAHARGIVHRDLKPDNIKVTTRGVKILDFGIAKQRRPAVPAGSETGVVTQTVGGTKTGAVMGTPAYMSPEQVRGRGVDERTDLWALGCVIYEMLSGRRAFGRETAGDTLAAVLTEAPDESWLPSEIPAGVRELLRSLLDKEVDARVADAETARGELEDVLATLRGADPVVGGRSAGLRAMTAIAIAVALFAGWYLLGGARTPVTDRSIAVLPFETLGQAQATSFTDGVHGDMMTRLSLLPDLRVTSRTSVMQYRNAESSLPEIAADLGVTWVLLGEVQEAGDQVQVNARLVDAREDRQVWAQSYRRELTAENLFEIQGELTEEIAAQLQAHLSQNQRRVAAQPPTRDLDAYRLYAEGRALLAQRTADSMRRSVDYFGEATRRDPEYALAWVGIASASVLLEAYGYAPPGSLAVRGFQAVETALEIAPDLAEAYASRALLLANDGRPAEAFEATKRAIELRPSYADAHSWQSVGNLHRGDLEAARASAERAVELDPLSVEAIGNLALSSMASGGYERSLQLAHRMQEIAPEYTTGRFYEAAARYHLGELDAAASLLEGLTIPWAGAGPRAMLAVALVRSGATGRARVLLGEIEDLGDDVSLGVVRAALGEREAALEAFERASEFSIWSFAVVRYLFPDVLGPLRDEPRFHEVLRKLDEQSGAASAPR